MRADVSAPEYKHGRSYKSSNKVQDRMHDSNRLGYKRRTRYERRANKEEYRRFIERGSGNYMDCMGKDETAYCSTFAGDEAISVAGNGDSESDTDSLYSFAEFEEDVFLATERSVQFLNASTNAY